MLSQALSGSLGELKQGQTEPPKGSFDARQSKLAASLVELTGSVILAAPRPTLSPQSLTDCAVSSSPGLLALPRTPFTTTPILNRHLLPWAQSSSSGLGRSLRLPGCTVGPDINTWAQV